MSLATSSLHVTLGGGRDYDILIGRDCLSHAGSIIKDRFGVKRLIVIRDPNVPKHCELLSKSLQGAGHAVHEIVIGEGEGAKSWDALRASVDALLDAQVDRKTMIIALGGGVTGDHAGFAAAIALRGLDYIQIPTTLLAQVDSSVGGKTGINSAHGKNLIGAFHQPKLVLIDSATLETLPMRQMRAGYAEIVKYAFIRDAEFFKWLEVNGEKVLAKDPSALEYAITKSCAAKAEIVIADEKESGVRALLNFGHTFAHTLESACAYDGRLLHGEAVSVGMVMAFETSLMIELCSATDVRVATKHLERLGLPTRIRDIPKFPASNPAVLIDLMKHDKKAVGGRLTFILSHGIGSAFQTDDIDLKCLESAFRVSMGS